MTAAQMLGTSLLLGLFVLLAGCYGLLYCLGRLRASRSLVRAAAAAYLLQGVTAGLLARARSICGGRRCWWRASLRIGHSAAHLALSRTAARTAGAALMIPNGLNTISASRWSIARSSLLVPCTIQSGCSRREGLGSLLWRYGHEAVTS